MCDGVRVSGFIANNATVVKAAPADRKKELPLPGTGNLKKKKKKKMIVFFSSEK
jgi:hypothetical protein